MRIAVVHPDLDHRGGAENVVCWMARALQQRGHDVVVVTRRFSSERWNEKDWDAIPLIEMGPGRFDRWKTRASRGSGHQLRRAAEKCDLIVAHNSPAQRWATGAAQRMSARVVWYCEEPSARFFWRRTMPHFTAALADLDRHPWLRNAAERRARRARKDERGLRFAIERELDRGAASRVDLTLGNSAFTADNAGRVYGIDATPCLLGIPEPPPAVVSPGEPYVAWVTSESEHKNAYGFLEALHLAVHELGARDLCVRAVGLDESFERRIAELSLQAAVRCEGWIDDAELNALIAGCRLLAYPPIDEPFGLPPLHAMAHGRPVLASNIGGPPETVVDGATGCLVDPLDPRAMAERLVDLWSSPSRCDSLGAAGRVHYLAHFTFEHFMERFEALALCGEPAPARSSGD